MSWQVQVRETVNFDIHETNCDGLAGNICVYCPGGPDSDFEYSTQSYTGYEPTSMRAIRARYNPYVQARARVEQLRRLGHSVDKVSLLLSSAPCLRDWGWKQCSGHRSLASRRCRREVLNGVPVPFRWNLS